MLKGRRTGYGGKDNVVARAEKAVPDAAQPGACLVGEDPVAVCLLVPPECCDVLGIVRSGEPAAVRNVGACDFSADPKVLIMRCSLRVGQAGRHTRLCVCVCVCATGWVA